MIAYIDGTLVEKSPTHVIIDCGGVGYFLNISLNTFAKLPENGRFKLHAHEIIREDSRSLFGFADQVERQIFRLLISVSGVGANTARMILSSLSPQQLSNVILHDDVNTLKSVKGIGVKSAQRIIIDLRDKIGKEEISADFSMMPNNTIRDEALSALVMLGFPKNKATQAVDKTLKSEGGEISVEQLVKISLNNL
jgi:Holliday junction DNA helicase RuvA